MLPTQYLRAILDCLHDNHTKLWALSISFEIVFFFLMFHLPELVEDICFQSLNKVSLFPAPLFNQWTHINNTSSESLLCLGNLLNLNACEGSCHEHPPSLEPWQQTTCYLVYTFQSLSSQLPVSCYSSAQLYKDAILRKHSPRTKNSSKTVVSPTPLGSFLPFKRKYRIGNEL